MQPTIPSKYLTPILLLAMPLSGMNIDISVPSLPAITHYFAVDKSLAQLTITAYLVGFLATQSFVGPLLDGVGRKTPFLTANALYMIATLLAGSTVNIHALLFLRGLQGVCMGCVVVAARAIVSDTYRGDSFEKSVSTMSMVWASGPIIAPAIGGYLQTYLGWRAPFYFLGLYSALLFCLSVPHLPETLLTKQILKPKSILNNYKTILSQPSFLINATSLALLDGDMILFGVIGPFLIQTQLHYSAAEFGQIALCIGTALFLGAILNRVLIHIPSLTKMRAGLWLMLVDAVWMLIMGLSKPMTMYSIIVPVFIFILIRSMVYPNYSVRILNLFPELSGSLNALTLAVNFIFLGAISALAVLLKSNNQIPFSLGYIAICLICLALFYLNKQNRPEEDKE